MATATDPAALSPGRPGTVRVSVLGGVSVVGPQGRLRLGFRLERLLGVLLAHRGASVDRHTLIEAVWDGSAEPADAEASLRLCVSRLRRALATVDHGHLAIATTPTGYRLDLHDLDLDLDAVRTQLAAARRLHDADLLRAAIDQGRGRPYGSMAEEWWCRREATEHTEEVACATEELAEMLLATDERDPAVVVLRGLLAEQPERASAARLLARATAQRGSSPTGSAPTGSTHTGPPPTGRRTGDITVPSTSFVGREVDTRRLVDELTTHRLVTILGPGGVGKTRLAAEVGLVAEGRLPGAVRLCELGAVTGADVAPTVAAAMGIRPQDHHSAVDSIIESLAGRQLLLILDNCEHVLGPVALLAALVLAGCPAVRLLVTSREALGLQGERVYPLSGLEPEHDGVALFLDRARQNDAHFAADAADLDAITSICKRLDGIPLAIEMAAARVRSMTTSDIADRLDDRFRLLRLKSYDRPDRHHTLEATIDWSYHLLSDRERCLFERLAVFGGSFDAAAAAEVCGTDPLAADEIDDLLAALVDKSVLAADRSSGGTRFHLLESLRQFAVERVASITSLRCRHLDHYLRLAQQAEAQFTGTGHRAGRALFALEWHNIRAAHRWAVDLGDQARASTILDAVFWYAEVTPVTEVLGWAMSQIALPAAPPQAYGVAGYFESVAGDHARARQLADQGLAVAEATSSPPRRCWEAHLVAAWYSGQPAEALSAARNRAARPDLNRTPFEAAYGQSILGGISGLSGHGGGPEALAAAAAAGAPLANPVLEMWLVLMTAADTWARGRLDDALTGMQAAATLCEQAECDTWLSHAREMEATLTRLLGRPGVARLHIDYIRWAADRGLLSDLLAAIESVCHEWASAGRTVPAATIVGFLSAHRIRHVATIGRWPGTLALVEADEAARAALGRGATLDRDELIDFVLHELAEQERAEALTG